VEIVFGGGGGGNKKNGEELKEEKKVGVKSVQEISAGESVKGGQSPVEGEKKKGWGD